MLLPHAHLPLLQLKSGSYNVAREFLADVQQVWQNCMLVRAGRRGALSLGQAAVVFYLVLRACSRYKPAQVVSQLEHITHSINSTPSSALDAVQRPGQPGDPRCGGDTAPV